MIIGTAGHIDHGKTTLVRALTGTDTDRLPEEKRRGISIELGYAYLDVPGDAADTASPRLGFIDVPGHEKLVATMLSGASGIDHALLLVAADDGVMPQTREHVAGLALLGIGAGTVAITKADRATPERIAAVEGEVHALLHDTPLAGSPVFTVAATSGQGVDALRTRLLAVAAAFDAQPRDEAGHGFRLAIDRVFSLAGVGTVATGSAHAGVVAVGDALAVAPLPETGQPLVARVRGLHAQDRAVPRAAAGQRVAVNLAAVERAQLPRGHWLVDPRIALVTDRLDAALTVWREEAKPLRSGTVVHVHLGSRETMATVAVLDGPGKIGASAGDGAQAIAPGTAGRVQLVLRERIAAWRGDRVVLRDAGAQRMVAGGAVIDPLAPARYRRSPARLAELDALQRVTAADRLRALLAVQPNGVDLDRFRRAEGLLALPDVPPDALLAGPAHDGSPATSAFGAAAGAAWLDRIESALTQWHADAPDELGPDAARLRRRVAPRLDERAWAALVERAIADARIARSHGRLHRPSHAVRLSAAERRLGECVLPRLLEGGFDPPWLRTLATDLREPEAALRAALLRLAQRGELHHVVKDLFYPPQTMARAAALVRDIAARDGAVTAAAFRDATGLGRKRAIQIIEYFDRAGLLRRVGDEHRIRGEWAA